MLDKQKNTPPIGIRLDFFQNEGVEPKTSKTKWKDWENVVFPCSKDGNICLFKRRMMFGAKFSKLSGETDCPNPPRIQLIHMQSKIQPAMIPWKLSPKEKMFLPPKKNWTNHRKKTVVSQKKLSQKNWKKDYKKQNNKLKGYKKKQKKQLPHKKKQDSLTLLHVLLELQRRSPVKFTVSAATVNPETPEFSPEPLIVPWIHGFRGWEGWAGKTLSWHEPLNPGWFLRDLFRMACNWVEKKPLYNLNSQGSWCSVGAFVVRWIQRSFGFFTPKFLGEMFEMIQFGERISAWIWDIPLLCYFYQKVTYVKHLPRISGVK